MDSMQALNAFWNSHGLKAYDEYTVPDNSMQNNGGKYITYSAAEGYFDEPVALTASLWYRSTSWGEITKKAQEIGRKIGYGGLTVPFDGGSLWIKRGSPFSQRIADEDDTIRRIFLNIEVEFLTSE